jgi:hypothetical protein
MEESRAHATPDEDKHDEMACPFCLVMNTLASSKRKHSAFFHHLTNAQIELLQAFKSVIDQQISDLEEKKKNMAETKKATKIEVE